MVLQRHRLSVVNIENT